MVVRVKHILGEFDQEEQVQKCIICGEIIHDYREAMYAPDENGNIPQQMGWMPGEHYATIGNPISYTMSYDNNDIVIPCNLPIIMDNNINK